MSIREKKNEDDGALTVTSARPSHGCPSVSFRDGRTAVRHKNKRQAETETEPATCSGIRYAKYDRDDDMTLHDHIHKYNEHNKHNNTANKTQIKCKTTKPQRTPVRDSVWPVIAGRCCGKARYKYTLTLFLFQRNSIRCSRGLLTVASAGGTWSRTVAWNQPHVIVEPLRSGAGLNRILLLILTMQRWVRAASFAEEMTK